jgi:hypothetical protein
MTQPQLPGEPGRADAVHEAKCRRCGISCHVAVPVLDQLVVVPGLHCKHLEQTGPESFACTVYDRRVEQAPWCHHADLAQELGYLAADCPYNATPGRGKVRLVEAEFARQWPRVLDSLRRWGVPRYVSAPALIAEVQRREGEAYTMDPWPRDAERWLLRPVSQPAVAHSRRHR